MSLADGNAWEKEHGHRREDMEDIHGNQLFPGNMVVNSAGKLFKLTSSHYRGIQAMKRSWFKQLTRVTNIESVVQKTTIKLKDK